VDEFMVRLEHPHKAAIEELRAVLRGCDPSVAEGVKWNAPSFRTTGYFATTHLRAKSGVGIILHLGAKVRDGAALAIDDPDHRLAWLAKDRAMLSFAGLDDVRAAEPSLQHIVRQWIQWV
jgi:hypothetical protein